MSQVLDDINILSTIFALCGAENRNNIVSVCKYFKKIIKNKLYFEKLDGNDRITLCVNFLKKQFYYESQKTVESVDLQFELEIDNKLIENYILCFSEKWLLFMTAFFDWIYYANYDLLNNYYPIGSKSERIKIFGYYFGCLFNHYSVSRDSFYIQIENFLCASFKQHYRILKKEQCCLKEYFDSLHFLLETCIDCTLLKLQCSTRTKLESVGKLYFAKILKLVEKKKVNCYDIFQLLCTIKSGRCILSGIIANIVSKSNVANFFRIACRTKSEFAIQQLILWVFSYEHLALSKFDISFDVSYTIEEILKQNYGGGINSLIKHIKNIENIRKKYDLCISVTRHYERLNMDIRYFISSMKDIDNFRLKYDFCINITHCS
jgi:hypothetical protein